MVEIQKNFQKTLSSIQIIKIKIEEMESQYPVPISMPDGKKFQLQIKHKNENAKKRKVKTWSAQQDNQLILLYEKYPKKWANIAALMADRNQNQCLHRYRRLSQLGINRKIWSAEEDETVKKFIKKVGKNWKLLSEIIGTKTGKQIRQRFINKLDPKIKREDWSEEEDKKIIELYVEMGSKWSQISKKLPGRPQNKIKNRFYSYIQKNYDIKFQPIEQEVRRVSLKEIGNEAPILSTASRAQLNECQFGVSQSFPSIREIDFEVKQQCQQPQIISQSKIYIHSLAHIDEEWLNLKCNLKSFDNFNENQNSFFATDLLYTQKQ